MTLTPEDRLGLTDLYARNAWALDTGDADAFLDTFAENAVLELRASYAGRDGILWFFQSFLKSDVGYPRAQHVVSQIVLEGEGDLCRGRSYVTRVHRLPGQHRGNVHVMWSGYSLDLCVREPAGWVFRRRMLKAWEGDVRADIARAALLSEEEVSA